ncbi:hypothetical protein PBV87_00530 [Niameybacter massiliensis]|uniref:Uncharacterized protein n=1 Tax=Holtiella tumoricola TaxID=3018743 RepID=A0AA42DJB5_9FIRM|nr:MULTISPECIES: hypothetical protein [Lachnospirales]MDA3729999.1 hypothetical protein [Holtiella tumoricola]
MLSNDYSLFFILCGIPILFSLFASDKTILFILNSRFHRDYPHKNIKKYSLFKRIELCCISLILEIAVALLMTYPNFDINYYALVIIFFIAIEWLLEVKLFGPN